MTTAIIRVSVKSCHEAKYRFTNYENNLRSPSSEARDEESEARNKKRTRWPESASELYRPRDRRLLAKLVPTFADRVCHVVSVTNPYGRIVGFLDRSRYFFIQAAPQLYSRG
jgi:hypothetical protein